MPLYSLLDTTAERLPGKAAFYTEFFRYIRTKLYVPAVISADVLQLIEDPNGAGGSDGQRGRRDECTRAISGIVESLGGIPEEQAAW